MRALLLFLVLATFVFCMVFSATGNGSPPAKQLALEFSLGWTLRLAGAAIAGVSALAILMRSLAGQTLEQQLGFAVPLLAGLLLVNANWGVSLALGLLGAAIILRPVLARRARSKAEKQADVLREAMKPVSPNDWPR